MLNRRELMRKFEQSKRKEKLCSGEPLFDFEGGIVYAFID